MDKSFIINKISKWIYEYVIANNKAHLFVGLSGGINSCLTAFICKKSGIRTSCLIGVPTKYDVNILKQANNFCDKYSISLDVLETHTDNASKAKTQIYAKLAENSDIRNGLIVGAINKTRKISRSYYKYGELLCDMFPIADLYESECIELYRELFKDQEEFRPIFDNGGKKYYMYEDAIQLSYSEIEWCYRQHKINNILADKPQNYKHWYKFSTKQKEALSRLYQRIILTEHKTMEDKQICSLS